MGNYFVHSLTSRIRFSDFHGFWILLSSFLMARIFQISSQFITDLLLVTSQSYQYQIKPNTNNKSYVMMLLNQCFSLLTDILTGLYLKIPWFHFKHTLKHAVPFITLWEFMTLFGWLTDWIQLKKLYLSPRGNLGNLNLGSLIYVYRPHTRGKPVSVLST